MQKLTSVLLVLALLLIGCSASASTPASVEPRTRELSIDLGDGFTTQAQFTYPAQGNGPWPTVILLHGSGPYDMDVTYATYIGAKPLSANFKLLAQRLGAQGIAVLRFHKRGVIQYGKYDQQQVMKATTNQLILDTAAVVKATRALPEVDGARLYLYGWSQGAQVATHAAAADKALAGVILQGAPTSGWGPILRYQHITLAMPLLKSKVDKDGDGKLALQEWFGVPAGPASLMGTFYVWAPDSTLFAPKFRAGIDKNDDKLIDLEGELRPAIEELIQNPAALAAHEPARSIAEVLPELGRPALLLHGDRDGWVPVTDGEKIAAAAPDRTTFKRFSELGHALSPTADPAQDSFGVMEDAAIQAVIDWVKAR